MTHGINQQDYLDFALEQNEDELSLSHMFSNWLPDTIIDCHAHSGLPQHVLSVDDRTRNHMLSTFLYFTIEESVQATKTLHPSTRVQTLRFAKTFMGIDHPAANQYLLDQTPVGDRMALFGLPNNIHYTTKLLGDMRVAALKMYHAYIQPPAEKIYAFFKPEILEVAQTLGKPIILHLPLPITRSWRQLLKLTNDFPNLPIVLAHLGLSYYPDGLREVYKRFIGKKNIFLDTSLISNADCVELALRTFGSERIMYGSDQPLNLVRAKVYQHPKLGPRLAADYPYHWLDSLEQGSHRSHLGGFIPLLHWQCLLAVKKAILLVYGNDKEKINNIFYLNAKQLFGFP